MCDPPVVHRNFKSANILLDDELNPHVSDCGLANLAPSGSERQVCTSLTIMQLLQCFVKKLTLRRCECDLRGVIKWSSKSICSYYVGIIESDNYVSELILFGYLSMAGVSTDAGILWLQRP